MGLSASQARYLMLTAKQSDLQYQGQQINNERTVLSQQVSDLYNSLLSMEVPTPPSTTAYTTISYSCTNGTTQYSFDANSVKPNGEYYTINMSRKTTGHYMELNDGYKAVEKVFKKDADGNDTTTFDHYTIAGKQAYELTKENLSQKKYSKAYTELGDEEKETIDNLYLGYKQGIEHAQISDSDGKTVPIAAQEDDGTADANKYANYYFYIDDDKNYHFALATDVQDVDKTQNKGTAVTYDYEANGSYLAKEEIEKCKLEFDAGTGRMTKVSLPVVDETTGEITSWTTLALTATQSTDETAYKDAYAQYEYKKYLYDQEQQEINAKTSIIQQEDKNLELKLQRLDTENNEIKTELDAVKEVMKNNVETSYKTFSG